jgi:hypothetical protein
MRPSNITEFETPDLEHLLAKLNNKTNLNEIKYCRIFSYLPQILFVTLQFTFICLVEHKMEFCWNDFCFVESTEMYQRYRQSYNYQSNVKTLEILRINT